jgi:hypothetical protein
MLAKYIVHGLRHNADQVSRQTHIVHSTEKFPPSCCPIWRDLSWLSSWNHFHKFSLDVRCLRGGGEELLLEHHAELFPDALQLLEVLVVLALVLDLGVDACAAVLVCAPGYAQTRHWVLW